MLKSQVPTPKVKLKITSGQIVPKPVLLINYCSKFDETSKKDKL